MATYKVIQDIEADDKLFGPLTLKQFIFFVAGGLATYMCFVALTKGFGFAVAIFGPIALLGFFLAVPWSKDQPTEVWVLAKMKFYFKSRKSIWDQSGIEELVTITVPKKEEKQLTDNLSQKEVKSRLNALAKTIDSRGWAVKEATMASAYGAYSPGSSAQSDRLVGVETLPEEVPIIDTSTIPDVYVDETATSHNLDRMIEQSNELRKQQNLAKMEKVRDGVPLEKTQTPNIHITPPAVNHLSAADEDKLTQELRRSSAPNHIATSNMRTLNPIETIPSNPKSPAPTYKKSVDAQEPKLNTPVQNRPSADIISLANNNDLSVETIAHQAKKEQDKDSGEVVISLH